MVGDEGLPSIFTADASSPGVSLVRRIAKALFTVFFVSTLIFFLVRLLPGSPVEVFIAQLVNQFTRAFSPNF